jgi:hypothetical protein
MEHRESGHLTMGKGMRNDRRHNPSILTILASVHLSAVCCIVLLRQAMRVKG